MTPHRNDTVRPLPAPVSPPRRQQALFLGEPLAATPNLAIHTGLGSTPFVARQIPATTNSCYIARQFTRNALSRWDLQTICDDTVQIASELVANALRHGRSRTCPPGTAQAAVWLALALRPHTLLCVVRDPSRRSPFFAPPPPLAERNRGLPIVDALANSWGWTTDTGVRGKSVWARVALPVSKRASSEWFS